MNCHRNYPWYRGWRDAFVGRGLTIIGIHTPETKAEHNVDALRRRMQEAELDFPIVADNEKKNWNAWGNSIWPSVYLIDKEGYLRYWWYGELNWKSADGERLMRQRIEELLGETTGRWSGASAVRTARRGPRSLPSSPVLGRFDRQEVMRHGGADPRSAERPDDLDRAVLVVPEAQKDDVLRGAVVVVSGRRDDLDLHGLD